MSGVKMIERWKRTERLLAPECRDLLNTARVNIIGVTNLFVADIVKKYLPKAEIIFNEKARIPAWNFDNSRAVKEFGWKIQSVEDMVLDEINGTRAGAGLPQI